MILVFGLNNFLDRSPESVVGLVCVERSWLGTVLRVRVGLGENLGSLDCFARFEGEIEVLFSLKRRLCCATVRYGRKPVINSISPHLCILVVFSLNRDLKNSPSSTLLHLIR
jgi:hypothetical protein